jgi:hypothetical protein
MFVESVKAGGYLAAFFDIQVGQQFGKNVLGLENIFRSIVVSLVCDVFDGSVENAYNDVVENHDQVASGSGLDTCCLICF